MALVALRAEHSALMNSMYTEGILDHNFQQMQMLQDEDNPGFVTEVIAMFFEDAERLLGELTRLLEPAVVDYRKVDAYVHQLKGSSSSVGAHRMSEACEHFRQFCEASNKEGCLRALQAVKQDYHILQSKLNTMMRLEQQIKVPENQGHN